MVSRRKRTSVIVWGGVVVSVVVIVVAVWQMRDALAPFFALCLFVSCVLVAVPRDLCSTCLMACLNVLGLGGRWVL